MNVFVITSSIIITMTLPDGREQTQTRRIRTTGSTDFTQLEKLNTLSRRYCAEPFSADELGREWQQITGQTTSRRRLYLGSMLAAGSFAIFFGGSPFDGITGALVAVLICYLQEHMTPFCQNKIIFNLLVSVITGSVICGLARLLPFLHTDKIMIGVIMLLIPGIAMTNSIRDILVGNTISGIMRLIETLFWAGSLACGFMIAIWLIGGTI